MYDPRDIPGPLGTGEEADGLDRRSPCLAVERAHRGFGYLSPQGVQLARAHYYGMVTFQDECIGNVIALLEQKGIRDNTVIVYTGDHGDLLGDFNCFYKGNFLNGSVRIPSVWSIPGVIPAESRPEVLMGLQDVLPTLAALTDTQLGRNVQGMNLLPLIQGEKDNGREVYIGQCFSASSRKQQYMACTKEYKYIYSEMNGMEELYDLENDPDELKNRAVEQPDITAELRAYVIQWCQENGDQEMLEGNDLRRYAADVESLCEFRHGGMGWRWY
jgi:choline-sulfatase